MKIFISWSGQRSFRVAGKLKDWLPLVLPSAEPWLSTEDIRKGSRWQTEMTAALQNPTAGILVLTGDNLDSSWLHFEAGAISQAVSGQSLVCTYLVGVENAAVALPLGMFQSTSAERDDTLRMIRNLNSIDASPIPSDRIDKLFGSFWPELEQAIHDAKAVSSVPVQVHRDDQAILAEILETVRGLARRAESPPADMGAIIRELAATPGTSTNRLFGRIDSARRRSANVPAGSSLHALMDKGRHSTAPSVLCPFCSTSFAQDVPGGKCPECGKSVV